MTEAEHPDYSAMTLNERLVAAGLLDAFDGAARERDRERMIELLRRVDVGAPERTVDTILRYPDRYGY